MVLTAVFEEVPASEGGGYVAYAEELPGAISEGNTFGRRFVKSSLVAAD